MKKTIILLAVACLMVLTGCTSQEKKIENCAKGFLSAYFAMDYDKASSFCTENVAEAIKPALDNAGQNSIVLAKIKELSKTVSYEIVAIDTEREEKKAHVKYNVKSESPSFVFEKTMVLEKRDNGWKVAALSF